MPYEFLIISIIICYIIRYISTKLFNNVLHWIYVLTHANLFAIIVKLYQLFKTITNLFMKLMKIGVQNVTPYLDFISTNYESH